MTVQIGAAGQRHPDDVVAHRDCHADAEFQAFPVEVRTERFVDVGILHRRRDTAGRIEGRIAAVVGCRHRQTGVIALDLRQDRRTRLDAGVSPACTGSRARICASSLMIDADVETAAPVAELVAGQAFVVVEDVLPGTRPESACGSTKNRWCNVERLVEAGREVVEIAELDLVAPLRAQRVRARSACA